MCVRVSVYMQECRLNSRLLYLILDPSLNLLVDLILWTCLILGYSIWVRWVLWSYPELHLLQCNRRPISIWSGFSFAYKILWMIVPVILTPQFYLDNHMSNLLF